MYEKSLSIGDATRLIGINTIVRSVMPENPGTPDPLRDSISSVANRHESISFRHGEREDPGMSSRLAVMRSIHQLFRNGPVAGLDDGALLERFVSRHDEAAFAALMALHGPLVLGVCGRILHDQHDIEDAFQATFLVLVRRAGSIRDAGRLGPGCTGLLAAWRCGLGPSGPTPVPPSRAGRRIGGRCHDTRASDGGRRPAPIIDQEVDRLPASFRDAVVSCDLEGRSYAEAASRLHCPLGTLQSRLARGRARLRSRLIRRGVAPVAMAAFLAEGASAAVSEALAAATVRSAIATAMGKTAMAGSFRRRSRPWWIPW